MKTAESNRLYQTLFTSENFMTSKNFKMVLFKLWHNNFKNTC